MKNTPYKHLYTTYRWKQLRLKTLDRAGWQCAVCSILLTDAVHGPASPVVHHRIWHKGNVRLFYDESNLVALCKRCHDGPVQAFERHGKPIVITDNDGWPKIITI